MLLQEYSIEDKDYRITLDVGIPIKDSKIGIVLLHGAYVNRKSLSRNCNSLAEYIVQELKAITITPDFFGESKVKSKKYSTFENMKNIVSNTISHLKDEYNTEKVVCFGYSMGGILLGDIVQDVESIDAIATYGGLTNIDCTALRLKILFRILDRFRGPYLNNINFGKILWVFDRETRDYFNNVIVGNPDYNCHFLKYDYEFGYVNDLIELASNYTNNIVEWGKPALFMFGSKDRITNFSRKHLSDFCTIKNVKVRHIENGHHITPCRLESGELSKLTPFIEFVKSLF
jgi:hypothetical protein